MRPEVLDEVLRDWERWAAELLEAQISYPVLTFFRSQHSNQSWLGALTTMLDVSSLVLAGIDGVQPGQAKLTFAMARHAAVDLAQVVNARYDPETRGADDRCGVTRHCARHWRTLDLELRSDEYAHEKLAKLRAMYEPYVHATARNLMITLPPWRHPEKLRDNWQAGPWDRLVQAKGLAILGQKQRPELAARVDGDHF